MAALFTATFDSKTSGDATMTSTGANSQETGPVTGRQHSATQKINVASLYCTGSTQSFLEWIFTGTPTFFARIYFYRESAPSGGLVPFAVLRSLALNNARLGFAASTGELVVRNVNTTVATYPLTQGQWYRADWTASLTTSIQRVRLYTGAKLHSANTADAVAGGETLSVDGTGNLDRLILGQYIPTTPAVNFYIDEVSADSTALPPPFTPPAAGRRLERKVAGVWVPQVLEKKVSGSWVPQIVERKDAGVWS